MNHGELSREEVRANLDILGIDTTKATARVLAAAQAAAAARAKSEAWLTGWRTGATFSVVPDHYQQNDDFTAGWLAGREASRLARTTVEDLYGVVFDVVRPQGA